MAGLPDTGPEATYPIHLRTVANVWAALMVILYCSSLYGWIRPETLKYILPTPAPAGWLVLAGKTLLLSCATGTAMAMGYMPGRAAGNFIGLGGMTAWRIIPVGWAVSGALIMGLGLAGLLFQPVFVVLAALGLASSIPGWLRWMRSVRFTRPSNASLVFAIPSAVVLWALLLMLAAPEIFQDPLRYHLFFPNRFNLEHKWFFVDRYFFWSYMGPFHALYGQALSLGGTTAAKGVNLAAALANFAALVRIAAVLGIPARFRPVVYAALITQPGLMLITGSVFVEHAMAVYVLLALESILSPGKRPSRRLRELAVFLTLGFNTKFTAIFGLAGCLGAAVIPSVRGVFLPAIKTGWRPILALASALLLPWFAMKWLFTCDPVSPALAQAGFTTMDSSSREALRCFYEFARNSIAEMIATPDRLLAYPFIFSGGHEGFWEHPGPIISALIPLSILVFRGNGEKTRTALLFTAGSAAAWMVIVGGVSPHYIAALSPLWSLSLLAAFLESGFRRWRIISACLAFSLLFQPFISVVVVVKGWFPATVATGELPVDYYLQRFSLPADMHYPVRKSLEKARPRRGTTYVYGDDTSYYLDGRVFCDYELGNHPLIWEFASESPGPARLRIKFRQRGISHILFSTRWPDTLAEDKKLAFAYNRRTLSVMQDFWRDYSRPIIIMEKDAWPNGTESYVFEISPRPLSTPYNTDFSKFPPRLPGTCALTWAGDSAWSRGQTEKAEKLFYKQMELFPESNTLRYRIAVLADAFGRKKESRALVRAMEKSGWVSPSLGAKLTP